MNVAFRLTRRATPTTADALFIASTDAADLLIAVGREWPAVYPVAGGFVVVPKGAVPVGVPRAVRLRRPAGELYLPVDADLVPALRPDEMVALTRDRGLLFLPGGTVLAFDSTHPLPETALVTLGPVRRSDWQSFPASPELAESLRSIQYDSPPDAVAAILDVGKPDESDPLSDNGPVPEEARPPSAGLGAQITATAALGVAKFLTGLGKLFGQPGWAKAGADLARKALEQVPRFTEKILGQQEAALRELLRQLQSGDIEKALKRAPIAVSDPNDPPARLDASTSLFERDARYSLASLLTSGTGGGGVAWLGGGDVWNQLIAQYRRLAEEATQRGDVRRAAYLYGVLLRDPRTAAKVLDSGGLHRDAALIYRDKLNDHYAAADCFERAGCWDEAVKLYQQLEDYERAGDLYRRIENEPAALEMYGQAAKKLTRAGKWRMAGDLVRDKAGDATTALFLYRRGWDSNGPDARVCSERIIDAQISARNWDGLRALTAEAAERYTPPQAEEAGHFFGYVVGKSLPAEVKDDLQDRARMTLASHLRPSFHDAHPPLTAVSLLFGNHPKAWPGPVVRDARESLKIGHQIAIASPPEFSYPSVKLLPTGPIVAAVVARGSFDVAVANEKNEIVVLRSATGEVERLEINERGDIAGLAMSRDGRYLVVALRNQATFHLRCWTFSLGEPISANSLDVSLNPEDLIYLQPEIESSSDVHMIRTIGPDAERTFRCPSLVTIKTREFAPAEIGGWCTLSVPAGDRFWDWTNRVMRLRHGEYALPGFAKTVMTTIGTVQIPWLPRLPDDRENWFPQCVDYLTPCSDDLEFVGIDQEGATYWTEVRRKGDVLTQATAAATTPTGYSAACLLSAGQLAAVTTNGELHGLRADGSPILRRVGPARRLGHPGQPVFMAYRPQSQEVLVVLNDGTAVRVPRP